MENRIIALIENINSRKGCPNRSLNQRVRVFLEKNGIEVHSFATQSFLNLNEVVQNCLTNGIVEYIAIGGDGSLHALVNTLLRNKNILHIDITVGLIPAGTGNDWIRNFNFSSLEENLNRIVENQSRWIDIGKITYKDSSCHYFINIAGIGFNGAVMKQVGKFSFLGGLSYYAALVYTFFRYRGGYIQLRLSGERISKPIFLVSIGIGKYAGGNMKLCPDAIVDDGYFDINVIDSVSLWKLIRYLHTLKDGTYLQYINSKSYKTKILEVLENESMDAEADGELLTESIIRFEIVEKKIKIYY